LTCYQELKVFLL